MGKLTLFELGKIWGKRSFLIAMAAILSINVFLLWHANLSDGTEPELSAYKKLQEDIAPMTEKEKKAYLDNLYREIQGVETVKNILSFEAMSGEMGRALAEQERNKNPGVFERYFPVYEKGSYLRYTNSFEQEQSLIEEVYGEMEEVSAYPEYLEGIQSEKDALSGISIFAGSEKKENFSSRNLEKSAADYVGLEDTKITFFPAKGITSAMQNEVSDLLLLLVVFLFAGGLIYEEKEKRLFLVTRATANGRGKSVLAKLTALGIHAVTATVFVYGSNLLFFGVTTGLGDLFRSIQSVAPFIASNLHINVLTYILLSLLTKAAVLFGFGALVVFVSILAKQSFMPYLVGAAFLAGNLLLYHFVPAWVPWNWLKYLTAIGLSRTEDLYGGYLNFNFGGQPASRLVSSVWVLAVWLVISIAAVTVSFLKADQTELRRVQLPFLLRHRPHGSLFIHEGYKVLVMNRAIFVLLLFSFLIGYQRLETDYVPSVMESYYQNIMLELEGEITPEKETLVENEKSRYDKAFAQIDRIDEMVASGQLEEQSAESMKEPYYSETAFYPYFQRVLKQYDIVKKRGGEFVYDTGYLYLFGIWENGFMIDLLLLTLCLILAFSNVMAVEHQKGSWNLLAATVRGKRSIITRKGVVCLLCTALIGLVPFVCRLIRVGQFYPLHGLSAPIYCISAYETAGLHIPILLWIAAEAAVQIATLLLVTGIVLALSHRLKNHLLAVFVSVLLLVVPLVLKEMGINIAGHISLFPLYQILVSAV